MSSVPPGTQQVFIKQGYYPPRPLPKPRADLLRLECQLRWAREAFRAFLCRILFVSGVAAAEDFLSLSLPSFQFLLYPTSSRKLSLTAKLLVTSQLVHIPFTGFQALSAQFR